MDHLYHSEIRFILYFTRRILNHNILIPYFSQITLIGEDGLNDAITEEPEYKLHNGKTSIIISHHRNQGLALNKYLLTQQTINSSATKDTNS